MAAPTTVAPCWFNTKNKGETGLGHFRDPAPDFCSIRELAIEHSLYTYCSNHPYRRPDKDPIPIGPVFVATPEGSRRIWQPSPDTEEVRLHLLELATQIPEAPPPDEYPAGPLSDEMVVWQ